MRQGIKLFEHFTNLILESRVGPDRKDAFTKEYAIATGESCEKSVGLFTRYTGWDNGLDTKIYFDAPQMVVDSLRKIGVNVLEGESHQMRYARCYESTKEKQCKYSISNNWLFWWLVDYGYRLGENNAIPYDFYLMREALKAYQKRQNENKYLWHFDINQIESENPTVEAEMLMTI